MASTPTENEYQSLTFHPYNIILSLMMIGITALFVAFSVSYMYTRIQTGIAPIKIPNLFIFNTLILLASSGTMMWARKAYETDNTQKYQQALVATFALSVIFMIAQYIGWKILIANNLSINETVLGSYVWVISIAHFAHLVAGLPFLMLFIWTAYKRMKTPVSVLVYFSDPEKLLKLNLLTRYWHYLDILWIYLVLFFWVNYFFQA